MYPDVYCRQRICNSRGTNVLVLLIGSLHYCFVKVRSNVLSRSETWLIASYTNNLTCFAGIGATYYLGLLGHEWFHNCVTVFELSQTLLLTRAWIHRVKLTQNNQPISFAFTSFVLYDIFFSLVLRPSDKSMIDRSISCVGDTNLVLICYVHSNLERFKSRFLQVATHCRTILDIVGRVSKG